MTIEEQIKQLMPQMTEQVAAEIRKRALSNLEGTVAYAISEEVKKYVADVVIPSVRADLEQHEAEIKASVLAAVKALSESLAVALVEQVQKKLASYEGEKLRTLLPEVLKEAYVEACDDEQAVGSGGR